MEFHPALRSEGISGSVTGAHMMGANVFDGFQAEFPQDILIDVGQPFDVKAGFAHFIVAQFGKEGMASLRVRMHIEGKGGLPGGESEDGRFPAVPAGVGVAVMAKSDDSGPPHPRFPAGPFLQKGNQPEAVFPFLFIFHIAVHKCTDILIGKAGFWGGHGRVL
jgi:hypothetical protein